MPHGGKTRLEFSSQALIKPGRNLGDRMYARHCLVTISTLFLLADEMGDMW